MRGKEEVPLIAPAEELTSENLVAAPVAVPAKQIPSTRPAPKINPTTAQPAKAAAPRPAPAAQAPKSAAPLDLKGKIIAKDVHVFIDKLLRIFDSMKQDGENFADFTDRVPKDQILAALDAA